MRHYNVADCAQPETWESWTGLTLKDDWKYGLSAIGGPSARAGLTTSTHLSRVLFSDSGTFVRVQTLRLEVCLLFIFTVSLLVLWAMLP